MEIIKDVVILVKLTKIDKLYIIGITSHFIAIVLMIVYIVLTYSQLYNYTTRNPIIPELLNCLDCVIAVLSIIGFVIYIYISVVESKKKSWFFND